MSDHPARPAGDDSEWGSPLPAEYGSLSPSLRQLELRIDELGQVDPPADQATAPTPPDDHVPKGITERHFPGPIPRGRRGTAAAARLLRRPARPEQPGGAPRWEALGLQTPSDTKPTEARRTADPVVGPQAAAKRADNASVAERLRRASNQRAARRQAAARAAVEAGAVGGPLVLPAAAGPPARPEPAPRRASAPLPRREAPPGQTPTASELPLARPTAGPAPEPRPNGPARLAAPTAPSSVGPAPADGGPAPTMPTSTGAPRAATDLAARARPPAPASRRAAPAAPPVSDTGGWGSVAVPADDAFVEAVRRDRTPRPTRAVQVAPEPRRRSGARHWPQSRWMVRHFDVWSVVKISLAFYLLMLVAFVVASVLLWYLADAFGAVTSIEKSARTLFSLKSVKLHPAAVAQWTAAGGAVLCVAGTFLNILAALTYNLISDLIGGIRFDVVDTDRGGR